MNVMSNNAEQIFNNRTGFTNVSGNNNRFIIRSSDVTININGNNNQFRIKNARVNFIVNGSNNQFQYQNSSVGVGFNGSNNTVSGDAYSFFNCQYSNGHNNHYPGNMGNNRHQIPNINRTYNNVQPYNRTNTETVNSRSIFSRPIEFLRKSFQAMMTSNNRSNRQNIQNIQNIPHQYNNFQFVPQNVQAFNEGRQQVGEGLTNQQLSLLPRSQHEGAKGNCSICMCDVEKGEQQTFLMCFHSFHWSCIKDWMVKNAKCPVCQYDVKKYLSQ